MDRVNLTRRSFVKATALAGAVAAVGASASGDFVKAHAADSASSSEKIVRTACRACISNCAVKVTVRDGRVVRIQSDDIDPMSRGRKPCTTPIA